MQVEHVLDERALELGALAEDDRETRARELHAAREVEDAEALADLHVVGNRVGGVLPLADVAHDLVGRGVGPGGNLRRGDVGNHEERLAEVNLDLGEFAVDFGDAVADRAHLLLGGGDVLPRLRGGADLLRRAVALLLERLRLADERAALRVEVTRLGDLLLFHAAPRELCGGCVEFVPDSLDVDHC